MELFLRHQLQSKSIIRARAEVIAHTSRGALKTIQGHIDLAIEHLRHFFPLTRLKLGFDSQFAGKQIRQIDFKTDPMFWIFWIGKDERRTTLFVAAPDERAAAVDFVQRVSCGGLCAKRRDEACSGKNSPE